MSNIELINDKNLDCSFAIFKEANFTLVSGSVLQNFKLAFKTFGLLNQNKTNAILICHALTGDQYVTGKNPVTNKDGWWSRMVGPNKPIDTNKFFVICSNVLGGCSGSTGPKDKKDNDQNIYGGDFPSVTIKDMVNAQSKLLDALEIDQLFSVVGGSMGAMQALQWLSLIHI